MVPIGWNGRQEARHHITVQHEGREQIAVCLQLLGTLLQQARQRGCGSPDAHGEHGQTY